MPSNDRLSMFEKEIVLIESPLIRQLVERCLETAPDYFFVVPASSSAKHHPAYTLGPEGLVRHTRAAVRILSSLEEAGVLSWYYWVDEAALDPMSHQDRHDVCVAALILHDLFKLGDPKQVHLASTAPRHSVHHHPLLAARHIIDQGKGIHSLSPNIVTLIADLVSSHMGKFCFSRYSSTILPTPDSWLAHVVHVCDYLASRKCIEVQLGVNE